MTRLAASLLCLLLAQVFRSHADGVVISASVKRGNVPVADLNPEDFRVLDNGVPQTVEVLTVESVPIDVSLFIDTSGSTSGMLKGMRRDLQEIAAMLRPTDRFRVLTIGVVVDETVPWQSALEPMAIDVKPVPGISLIYDALFAGLMHRPDTGRRHLVVGLTDGDDCGSVIDGPTLLDAAARTDAVLHVIYAHGWGGLSPNGITAWCTPLDEESARSIGQAAERTGGSVHTSRFGRAAVREVGKILDDFHASYVLRYSPHGVPARGWHAITVDVPRVRGAKIRARSGYFVDR